MPQPVSSAFLTAALADASTPIVNAQLVLVDNTTLAVGASLAVTDSQDLSVFPPSQMLNGKYAADHKWAFADNYDETSGLATCLADGSWFPAATGYMGGWWSGAVSDSGGLITETITLTFATPTFVNQFSWYADPALTTFKAWVFTAYNGASIVAALSSPPGYSGTSYILGSSPTYVTSIKLQVSAVARAFGVLALLQFGASNIVDITNSLVSFNTLAERTPDTAALQIGSSSAGQVTLVLDNTAGLFGPANINSAYASYLRQNRRIFLQVGYAGTEMIPFGQYYTMNWSATGGSATSSTIAHDRMKLLRDRQCGNQPMFIGQTVSAIAAAVFQAAGFTIDDYIVVQSSIVVNYAWPQPVWTFLQYLTNLAAAVGGVIWVDERGIFHFEDALYLRNNSIFPVFTLTDSNAKISSGDIWDAASQVKNQVNVTVNTLAVAFATTIWSLLEVIPVQPFSSYALNITFSAAAIGVAQNTFAAGAGVTVTGVVIYAQGALITFTNPTGSIVNVTTYTMTGQLLTNANSGIVPAGNQALITQFGLALLPVNVPFIESFGAAGSLASSLLSLYQNPSPKLHVEAIGLPWLEIGDRITVNSPEAGIKGDYWLIRHAFKYDGGYHSSMDLISVSSYAANLAQILNLAAYYPLNETTGVVANEIVNGWNGSYVATSLGNIPGPAGSMGLSPLFDQFSYVALNTASLSAVVAGNTGTVAFWARLDGAWGNNEAATIFLRLGVDANNLIQIYKFSALNICYQFSRSGFVNQQVCAIGAPAGWVHFAMTWDYVNNMLKFFVNGIQTGVTQPMSGTYSGTLTTANFGPYNRSFFSSWWLQGLAFFTRNLTATELLTLAAPI